VGEVNVGQSNNWGAGTMAISTERHDQGNSSRIPVGNFFGRYASSSLSFKSEEVLSLETVQLVVT